MRKISADELHKILLAEGEEFDRICRAHGIPYYMLGGTMLGAVRHKGFIPWDDDMDFGVPREYFERCKVALETDLTLEYKLLSIDNCDGVLTEIIKISDTRTIVHELYKEDLRDEIGVSIDVFPLDRTDNNVSITSSNRKIDILNKIQNYRFLSTKQRPFVKKLVALAIKFLLCPLKRKSIINYIRKKLIVKDGSFIANHYGAWGIREIVPIEVMGSPKEYSFEGILFYGVADSDAYLKSLYGDYMQLPPEDKRHLHLETVCISVSDF